MGLEERELRNTASPAPYAPRSRELRRGRAREHRSRGRKERSRKALAPYTLWVGLSEALNAGRLAELRV